MQRLANILLTIPRRERDAADAAFDLQAQRWPVWEGIAVVAGVVCALNMGGPMSWKELGVVPIEALALLGWLVAWRGGTFKYILHQPTTWLFLAFAAWQWLGVLWSADTRLAVEQAGALRFGVLIFALWPLMRWRHVLVCAAAVGFLAGNAAQLGVWIGHRFDVPWLVPDFVPQVPGRNGGWWPAVAGGECLVAALGLHLPAALQGKGGRRWLAAALCAVTIAGMIATGTRGAWAAGAALVVIAGVVAIAQSARPGRLAGATLIAMASLAIGTYVLAGDAVARRVGEARAQVASALRDGDYDSDNGLRILMARWAWEAFTQHPIVGVGTGDYREWVTRHADPAHAGALARFTREGHGHAHNALLHTAATGGLVGVTLLTAWLGLGLAAAFRSIRSADRGTYAAGPAYALLGMILLTPFEVFHASAHTAAVLCFMLALCPAWRPERRSMAPTHARQVSHVG